MVLDLEATLTGPDGQPAPAGAVTLSGSSVTVPAGGSATVAVMSDTRHEGPDGSYSGRVVATAGDSSVVSPMALEKEGEQYELTVVHLDRDGKPTSEGGSILANFDKLLEPIFAYDEDGIATLRLPKGRYALEGSIWTDDVNHHLVQPVLRLDKDTTVTVDARLTKPVKVTVPRADAVGTHFLIGMDVYTGAGWISMAQAGTPERTFTAPLGDPALDQATAYVATGWGVPDAEGSFLNTPVTYSQFDTLRGGYFDGFTRAVQDRQMARVVAGHGAQVNRRRTEKFASTIAPGMFRPVGYTLHEYDLPSMATHYMDAGTSWAISLHEYIEDEWAVRTRLTSLWSEGRRYQAGRTYVERWNTAVFGPALPRAGDAFRAGNSILVDPPTYSDQDGHAGYSRLDTGTMKLYRDGDLLGESTGDGLFIQVDDVPGEKGDFRLVTTALRPGISDLSTRMDADWTFTSQTASENGELLPLWAIRYFPAVDSRNTVRRQPVTLLPLKLETQPGAKAGAVTSVDLRVSGDDGTTWTKAGVRRTGDNRYVAVFATPKGGHVSLKAKAADSAGNATEQTIIRAYALR